MISINSLFYLLIVLILSIKSNTLIWLIFYITTIIYSNNIYHRTYNNKVNQKILIILMLYLTIYFSSGLILGYSINIYKTDIKSVFNNIWSYVIVIYFIEYIRYQILIESRRSKIVFILSVIIFSSLEINIKEFSNKEEIFIYVTSILLPIIVNNILVSYISVKSGFYSTLVYKVSLQLIAILLPIVPRLPNFISLLFNISLYYIIYLVLYKKKKSVKNNIYFYIPFIIFILFMSGSFKYKPISIISNSMNPIFERGDIVVIKKDKKYNIGDIISYKKNNIKIVHRIVYISNNKYITKGDNNNYTDEGYIVNKDIEGKVKLIVPKIGIVSIYIYELFK